MPGTDPTDSISGQFTPVPPFRWDVRRREQLGGLLDGWSPTIADEQIAELLTCAARVVAFYGDGDLVFVGRSPDNLFDLLSGLLAETSWGPRMQQLPVSLKWDTDVANHAETLGTLRRYLASLNLAPDQINSRPRPTTLVDIVAEGRTFGELVKTWHTWADDAGIAWVQLRRKLRLVGITDRMKTSPKTRRWQQHADWAALLPPSAIKNVSADWAIWNRFADGPKASPTFLRSAWRDVELQQPSRFPIALEGLREAAYLYETGRAVATRERFAADLARTPGVREGWLRALLHEIRAHPGDLEGFAPVPDERRAVVLEAERRERNKRRRAVWRQTKAGRISTPTPASQVEGNGADA